MIAVLSRVARQGARGREDDPPGAKIGTLRSAVLQAASPLDRLEEGPHPWVAFVVMALFAVASAGMVLDSQTPASGMALPIATGPVLAKPSRILHSKCFPVRRECGSLAGSTMLPAPLAAGRTAEVGFRMSPPRAALGIRDGWSSPHGGGRILGSAWAMFLGLGWLWAALRRSGTAPTPPGVASR